MQNLEEDVARYHLDGNVIIGGDFNAKTGTKFDFVDDNLDKHSPIMGIETYITDNPINQMISIQLTNREIHY